MLRMYSWLRPEASAISPMLLKMASFSLGFWRCVVMWSMRWMSEFFCWKLCLKVVEQSVMHPVAASMISVVMSGSLRTGRRNWSQRVFMEGRSSCLQSRGEGDGVTLDDGAEEEELLDED